MNLLTYLLTIGFIKFHITYSIPYNSNSNSNSSTTQVYEEVPDSTIQPEPEALDTFYIDITTEPNPSATGDYDEGITEISFTKPVKSTLKIVNKNATSSEPTKNKNAGKECKCGISRPAVDYIVGGTETNPREFPFIAALTEKRWQTQRLFCGATLINSRYLVTAAHCVQNKPFPELIKIWFNAHRLSALGKDTDKSFSMTPKKFIIHENWSTKTFENDIALIELSQDVKLDQGNVSTVCLPTNDKKDYSGKHGTAAGWGYVSTTSGRSSNVLRKVTVPILSNKVCETKGLIGEKLVPGMLCGGYKEGKRDACINDSGGPFMVKENDRDVLVGIVSFGQGCALKDTPGVYTRITRYLSWIEKNMDGGSQCRRD